MFGDSGSSVSSALRGGGGGGVSAPLRDREQAGLLWLPVEEALGVLKHLVWKVDMCAGALPHDVGSSSSFSSWRAFHAAGRRFACAPPCAWRFSDNVGNIASRARLWNQAALPPYTIRWHSCECTELGCSAWDWLPPGESRRWKSSRSLSPSSSDWFWSSGSFAGS